jgi:hypothetical protein
MTTATMPLTVRVPEDADFGGADFLDDPTLGAILDELIRQYDRLGAIEEHGISVLVLWKRKGGKKQGAPTFAKCQKPSGLLAHFCTSDFVIWLGADTISEQEWTTEQIRKLLYHEARHIGWDDGDPEKDEPGKPIILGHDVELFAGEVADTGAWEHFRGVLANDFEQAGLFAR